MRVSAARVGDVVDLEAVVVALNHVVPREREIRVRSGYSSPACSCSMNAADGRVLDTTCMFHAACPASNQPAWSPTRGSGTRRRRGHHAGDGVAPASVEELFAQPATDRSPAASVRA